MRKKLCEGIGLLATTPPSGGTSLGLKLELWPSPLIQDDSQESFIELNLEYARAWAAVDRALKEALINVNDLDRDEGVFMPLFREDQRVLLKNLSGDSFNGDFRI